MGSTFYHIVDWFARPSLYHDILISKQINIQNCINKRPIKTEIEQYNISNDQDVIVKSGREIITRAADAGFYDTDEYNYLLSSYPLEDIKQNPNDIQRAIYLRRLQLYNLTKNKIYCHSQQIMASKDYKPTNSPSYVNSIINALADEPEFYESIINPPTNYMPALSSLLQIN